MTLGELVWKITGDSSGLSAELEKAKKKAEQTGEKFSKTGALIKAAIGLGLGVAVAAGFKKIVDSASKAEETAQKFGVVFSSVSKEAQAAAQDLQKNYLYSAEGAQALLSQTGDLLTGLGLTQQEALKLSIQTAQLGSDLASFSNFAEGGAGATDRLTKAMLGETEGLKALGIAISQTELKKLAESQGKVWESMSRGEKAALTLSFAMSQSKNAIGDVSRSSESFANTMRAIESRGADFSAELGQRLLPALSSLGQAFLLASADGGILMEGLKGLIDAAAFVVKGFSNVIDLFNVSPAINKSAVALQKQKQIQEDLIRVKTYANTLDSKGLKNVSVRSKLEADARDKNSKSQQASIKYLNLLNSTQKQNVQNEKERVSAVNELDKIGDRMRIKSAGEIAAESAKNAALIKQGSIKQQNAKFDEKGAEARDKEYKAYLRGIEKANAAVDKLHAKKVKNHEEELEAYYQLGQAGVGVISALGQLAAAQGQARLDSIEAEKNAELARAGLLEETEVMKAQAAYEKAVTTGNQAFIDEKKRILDKAKIEDAYAKKRAQAEFEIAETAYNYRVAEATAGVALAIMSAYISGAKLNLFVALAQGALMAATAGIQLAAVMATKPKAPKFAQGGIVPGNSFSGDNVPALVNSREMILSESQQAELFKMANGGGANGMMRVVVNIGSEQIYDQLYKASENGEFRIANRAVI